ncbi:MAG: succinylglutamate desuccinylase/aspartoacylase family protein [Bdellovibrionota bacterium]
MDSFVFGLTTTGLPIPAYRFGTSGPSLFVLGGVHGDEIEGVWAGYGLLKALSEKFTIPARVTLVPAFNLDGVLAKDRRNARKIDLNRNLPTNDWTSDVASERYFPGTIANSESENQALVSFLEIEKPKYVVSLHSWKPMLNINGDCKAEAETIAKLTSYVIEETIGYPTPGCLGTYAGIERGMPTLTYEIERGLDQASILRVHVPAVIASLETAARLKA